MKKRKTNNQALPVINPSAAGIDVGATFHVVSVSPDLCEDSVQTFQAFTSDIHRLADWLVKIGITTVAMESQAFTGSLYMKRWKVEDYTLYSLTPAKHVLFLVVIRM
ncbi:hypothetical protein [Leucothrix pacifica]|uniref:hypothetical protein n=1 Tax=Leucothrix pacifica TaxID=1247513 RepID=UPI001C643AE6|nr:hypothetical protein [Leucothrix pacifica]